MIKIICIGKIKEAYLKDAINEYLKRLSRFNKFEIVELKDSPIKENSSQLEDLKVKDEEGKLILSKITNEYVIALDPKGIELDSIEFSNNLSSIFNYGKNDISFIIGGSLGLSEEVNNRADLMISFSKLTFPHQLFRVILLEQIYRAYKIMKGETYNK